MIERVKARSPIDIPVNNAGQHPQPPHARDRRMGQRDCDQPHQRFPRLAGRLPGMKAAGGGKIINIG
jgi:hypothetical protein